MAAVFSSENAAVTILRRLVNILLIAYCYTVALNGVEIHFDESSMPIWA